MSLTRRLGNLERWSVARHNTGQYFNVIFAARYSIPDDVSFSSMEKIRERMETALRNVINRHEQLSYVLMDDTTKEPKFELLEKFDLNRLIDWRSEEKFDLEKIIEEQHQKRFETEEKDIPLWRLVVIPEKEQEEERLWILFVYHHGWGDGNSGMVFHNSLQHFLREGKEVTERKKIERLEPPLEELMEVKPGWGTLISTIASALLLPTWLSETLGFSSPRFWFGETSLEDQCAIKIDVRKGVKIGCWIFNLDEEVVTNMKKVCSENEVTITSVLSTIIAFSVAGLFFDQKTNEIELSNRTPINLRRYLRIPKDNNEMGDYVCANDFQRTYRSYTSFWKICKEYNAQLHDEGQRKKAIGEISMLRYIPDGNVEEDPIIYYNTGWEKFIRNKVNSSLDNGRSPRGGSVELSNIGVWKTNQQKEWNITSPLFSQSSGAIAVPISFSSVTLGVDGKMKGMSLVANWMEGVISREKVCEIFSLIEWGCRTLSEGKLDQGVTLSSFMGSSLSE